MRVTGFSDDPNTFITQQEFPEIHYREGDFILIDDGLAFRWFGQGYNKASGVQKEGSWDCSTQTVLNVAGAFCFMTVKAPEGGKVSFVYAAIFN